MSKQPTQTIKDIAKFAQPHTLDMGIVRDRRGQYLSVQLDGTDKMVRNVIMAEGVTVEVGYWVILNRVPRSNKWIVIAAVEDVARGSKPVPGNLPQPASATATGKPYMVVFSWEGSYKDVACYEIQHNSAASATGATEVKVAGSYYWHWCAPGTTRHFRVRAVNSSFARSSWSDWANATATAGTAYQVLGVNAGATAPEWAGFDWDTHGQATNADMVHSHASAAEGGDEIIPNRIGLGAAVADQDGTMSMAEAAAPTNAANQGRLYVKDDAGDTELFYMDDGGVEVQITADGAVNAGDLSTLYVYGNVGGVYYWDYDGVDGNVQTVIANGAEDVTEALWANSIVTEKTGAGKEQQLCWLEPGESQAIYSDGVDTCTLTVAADGSVTVQRTAGADTFKVALWLMWI